MNWIMLLICLMFLAILSGPASADTVTAAFPATLLSNPVYGYTVLCLIVLVVGFIGLLWRAAGADRPKIKAELLHTPQKPTVAEEINAECGVVRTSGRFTEAAALYERQLRPGEFSDFSEAAAEAKKMEPTWEIKESYDRGKVVWRLYLVTHHVRCSRACLYWHIKQERTLWGAKDGYDSRSGAEYVMRDVLHRSAEEKKPRATIQYDRTGKPLGEPFKV